MEQCATIWTLHNKSKWSQLITSSRGQSGTTSPKQRKAILKSVHLRYFGAFLVHPARRQNFAGKLHLHFYNIRDCVTFGLQQSQHCDRTNLNCLPVNDLQANTSWSHFRCLFLILNLLFTYFTEFTRPAGQTSRAYLVVFVFL